MTKRMTIVNNPFPSLDELKEEVEQVTMIVSADQQRILNLLVKIEEWLHKLYKDYSIQLSCQVTYDYKQPYDYFQVIVWVKAKSFTAVMARKLLRSAGKKCFPFKLTASSRQNTVGFIGVDEDDNQMLLYFEFVEW